MACRMSHIPPLQSTISIPNIIMPNIISLIISIFLSLQHPTNRLENTTQFLQRTRARKRSSCKELFHNAL